MNDETIRKLVNLSGSLKIALEMDEEYFKIKFKGFSITKEDYVKRIVELMNEAIQVKI